MNRTLRIDLAALFLTEALHAEDDAEREHFFAVAEHLRGDVDARDGTDLCAFLRSGLVARHPLACTNRPQETATAPDGTLS